MRVGLTLMSSHSACTAGAGSSLAGARLAGSEQANAIPASQPFYSIPFTGTVEMPPDGRKTPRRARRETVTA